MNYFYLAHAGTEHANAQEAVVHSTPNIVFTTVLVTALVGAFVLAGAYAIKRFATVKIEESNKEQS